MLQETHRFPARYKPFLQDVQSVALEQDKQLPEQDTHDFGEEVGS